MQPGGELERSEWETIHALYAGIYRRKYGTATLTPEFFVHLGDTMPQQVLVATARDAAGRIVAASLFFRSDTHLYGRVWGCDDYYHNLHFECCYYQGIEYCIAEGLRYFDPGAQGEHKLARGFLPTLTWSGHWIAHPQFREAINQFLHQERRHIEMYRDELLSHSPFRQEQK
jgi:predicted N-acyltransferase